MPPVTVQLVEDSRPLRELTRILLEQAGRFKIVAESENGLQAIEDARRAQPDLILLDLAMPVMNGFDALPQIRKAAPKAKIIALSMLNQEVAAARAIALGAHDFLDKGTPDEDLANTLGAMYDRATAGPPPGLDAARGFIPWSRRRFV